jgi:hypothetical protein
MTSSAALVAVLIVVNVVAWTTVSWFVRRRRATARLKPFEWVAPGSEAGTFAPLATVAPVPAAESPPQPIIVHPVAGAATTYEIVWYRQGERIVFALQPMDGRSALLRPMRSETFRWNEDRDPPAGLRDAQREHGRLRERLLRDGWRRAGRGERWFSHRFRPPGT